LHDDVVRFLRGPASKAMTAKPDIDAGHGRIETRTATGSTNIAWFNDTHPWLGLKAIEKVDRVGEITGKTTAKTAYYPVNTALTPERLNKVARSHWGWKTACTGGWLS
jgi:hypothetical protein